MSRDQGDWDMHPSDAEPDDEQHVYDPSHPEAPTTPRPRRSLDDEAADELADRDERAYWKRSE